MRILIVEDEKRLAMTLKDLLEQAGYQADMAFDGNDGLELAKSDIRSEEHTSELQSR